MIPRERLGQSPVRFGLTDDRAEERLATVGLWTPQGPAPGSEPVLAALSRTADPDQSLIGLLRLQEAGEHDWQEISEALHQNPGFRGRLLAVLGGSTVLTDVLVGAPEEWTRLVETREASVTDYTAELLDSVRGGEGLLHGKDAIRALRAAYRGVLLEIAASDLGYLVEHELEQPSYAEITARLTALAEAALRAGLELAWNEQANETTDGGGGNATDRPGEVALAVIAMGKCGGRELNYVSDVDVVFVAEGDLVLAGRVASEMMRLVGAACFQVDAALRPEGKAGALVRTLDSHATYYRRWARTWEFQALLKARPVAGDAELGDRYAELVAPMVWTAAERENFVTDVRRMRMRVEEHVPSDVADREIKLGRGGLRDVEFAVQLLQLVHGRVDTELRSASTMEALAALGRGGYVARSDVAELESSYAFLRMIEHRLQLRRLRRTHLFPEPSATGELRWLARACGAVPRRGRTASEVLQAEFRSKIKAVRRLHEKLFYRPLLEAVAKVPAEELQLTTEQAKSRLAALGYTAPEGALNHIKALTSGVSRRAAIQQTLLPVLLDLLAATPDPDGGLLAYRKVSEALAETHWYLRVLRDESAVVENLAMLLGTSKFIPSLLVRAPEVLQQLGNTAELAARDPAEVAGALRKAVARHRSLQQAIASARALRRHEMLRVASADVLGAMGVRQACEALSSVWAAVLEATLAAAQRGTGEPIARIAVIGMGRLGGGELGYGSDADVLFVCEPFDGVSDAEAVRFATGIASTVSRLLGAASQDPPLKVDADLRPEGRNGPLVRTLDSYRAYYERWGEVWEWQALLRARPVAGDAELGRRFVEMIEPIRYPEPGLTAAQAREIRRIKARVDTERLPRSGESWANTKLGPGGLGDIEWTVQLLQLCHAHEHAGLRTTSTLDGIEALAGAGLLDAADAATLTEGWCTATRVRNAATLVRGKPVDAVPTSGKELAAVAAVLGYSVADDPGEFVDQYRRVLRHTRSVVERVFYEG
ncbi:bifunctional [glutamine synthetase] adenylyltransferase/[glutamine synthetase]-adenylyl-L-tyrosine phosphorylase [Haloechinothrix sp. LS1_15]|uniref:bifunctional [glutamine synthetase] adenylyltransferase/[glutamine synthetase]-adenylyl-L-tyrosine phosphorylase n=1 Tax=Haloechinothrix sp. LS1_15 TaxID=2652248 RepID=UPI0029445FA8|nr:bifunctional [glutamine synthetase] adenylyltransferase/[glutamine synthetase]-adenylyl-L-tyrosine phosphorylase [Haloechinothrix sp. LS1_15]MDV6014591.1 bifunctional [glutamine synthetase] adenylyltransferase/[glutamine synthetase]-adenylyl-L-tyrosine phosphorylase [Haloechinothrix sp. LS1_15]